MEKTPLTADAVVKILNSRNLIAQAGVRYNGLRVTSATEIVDETTGEIVTLVNLNAMTIKQVAKAKTALISGDLQTAANTNLVCRQRNGKDYLPTKGELVNAIFAEVSLRDGGSDLRVASLTPAPSVTASKVSFSLTEEPVSADAGER
jgi:hypothetical protein